MPAIPSLEDVLVPRGRSSFARTGLITDSVIQLGKLATVDNPLIIRILGEVDDMKAEINPKLATCYRL